MLSSFMVKWRETWLKEEPSWIYTGRLFYRTEVDGKAELRYKKVRKGSMIRLRTSGMDQLLKQEVEGGLKDILDKRC